MTDKTARAAARAALEHYDLDVRSLTLVAESFNTVFRAVTPAGTYAVRVGSPLHIHADGIAGVEQRWTDRLGQQGVRVPRVVPNRDGRPETHVSAGRTVRGCVVFEWVHGRTLRTFGPRRAALLGRLAARLHADAAGWCEAAPDGVLVPDHVLYFRVPDALPPAGSAYGSVFQDARDRAQKVLDALWRHSPGPPQLLHGDLHEKGGFKVQMVPLDFQDAIWGFVAQDLSITLTALRRQPDAERAEASFRAGYAEVRRWPDVSPELMDALVAARQLNMINLTVNNVPHTDLGAYLARHAELLRAWLAARDV